MVREFFKVAAHGLGFLALMALLFWLLGFGGFIGGLLFYAVVQQILSSSRKKLPIKPANR